MNAAHFIATLSAQVDSTLRWWSITHPDRPLDPGVATGLCPRRVPTNRHGQAVLGLDERLWERGRARYGVRR